MTRRVIQRTPNLGLTIRLQRLVPEAAPQVVAEAPAASKPVLSWVFATRDGEAWNEDGTDPRYGLPGEEGEVIDWLTWRISDGPIEAMTVYTHNTTNYDHRRAVACAQIVGLSDTDEVAWTYEVSHDVEWGFFVYVDTGWNHATVQIAGALMEEEVGTVTLHATVNGVPVGTLVLGVERASAYT